jgi:hypothetical protein
VLVEFLSKPFVYIVLSLSPQTSYLIINNGDVFQILSSELVFFWEIVEMLLVSSILGHLALLISFFILLGKNVLLKLVLVIIINVLLQVVMD